MSYKFKSKSLIHKLHARELYGGFTKKLRISAVDLFDRVPEEQILNLGQVFEKMGNHVFMGTTYCGRFLVTYSIQRHVPQSDFVLSSLVYILHLWSFSRAPHCSKKVAEVHLFAGCTSEITTRLNITVAQWPTLQDKLIIYGETEYNCPSTGDSCNTFLTITHLPSLESCPRCKHLAEMYQHEERDPDLLKNNNRCLKHGATLDAMFMLAHPHPKLDIRVNSKCPNRFLVNTGNSLHILSMEIRDVNSSTPSSHNQHSFDEVSKPILNAKRDYKVTQDLHKIYPTFKFLHLEDGARRRNVRDSGETDDEQENFLSIASATAAAKAREDQRSGSIMAEAEKIYAFEEFEDGCEMKFKCLKWFRKRKLADKMYEFCSDDDDVENARFSNLLKELRHEYKHSSQPKTSKVSFGRFLKIRLNPHSNSPETSRRMPRSPCEKDDEHDETPPALLPWTETLHSELFLKTDSICSKPDNCDVSSIISDWESQDTVSLSPKSDISNVSDFSTSSMPGPSSGIRFSLKIKKPRHSLKKYTSTYVTGCQADSSAPASKSPLEKSLCVILKPHNRLYYPVDDTKSSSSKIDKRIPEPNQNLISGCCDDFERFYVLNDADSQVTAESEVDCCEDGNEVPIVVRGASILNTSKLKLISDPSEVTRREVCAVKQKTLDIEQLCFKAADLICKNENYKFRSCNDYDVEVVNVCPVSGDVIAAVSMRINAWNSRVGPPLKKHALPDRSNTYPVSLADLRREFDTCCILTWNVDTLVCRVEAYTPLRQLEFSLKHKTQWNNRTVEIARVLRFQHLGNFNAPCLLPRCVDHKITCEKNGEESDTKSITELHDRDNLAGFRLDKKYVIQEIGTDSEDEVDDIILL